MPLPAKVGASGKARMGGNQRLSNYLTSLILAETAGGVYWPLDDTGAFARAVNPSLSLGRNIVINGTFAADATWTKGTNWAISGGVATHTPGNTANLFQDLLTNLVIGKSYEIVFTVLTTTAGSITPKVGSTGTGTARTANGTYTQTIVCSGSTNILFTPSNDFDGSIDNVTVKQVNILASSAYPSAELLTDGNMEAVGTAAWTAGASATLSKQTGTPHGGAQVLRVARNGSNNPDARQSVLSAGKTYRVTGYARSDGAAVPRVVNTAGAAQFTGSTSTSWQSFDFQYVADGALIRFQANTSTGTEYTEFDDVSVTEVNPLTGVISGATVNQDSGNPRIGKCYSFDGVNDVVNVYSGDLNSVFNPDEFTLIIFAQVASAGVWTDGVARRMIHLQADANNIINLSKSSGNNQITHTYLAGGVTKVVTKSSYSPTGITMHAITVSKAADQLKLFLNGVQDGVTVTGLGTWVGNLVSTGTVIGAINTSGGNPWSGFLSHPYLANRAMSAAELLTIAQRGGVA